MKLIMTTIRSVALPPGKREKTFFDDDLPGFGLRLRAGGSHTWVIQYKHGGKHRRMVLGSATTLDPGKARTTAKHLLAAVRLGRDPAGERLQARAEAAETFGALLPRYLTRQRARLKPRSYAEVERHLLVNSRPFHARGVGSIDRRAIAIRLTEIAEANGRIAANRVRASLSAYFTWLTREGLVEANPVVNTNRAPENGARERVLDDSEIREIWQASGDDHYGAIIRLLTLTGARRDEIASLCWSEIDFDKAQITLPPERVKNKRVFELPLSPPALEILQAQPRRMLLDGSFRNLIFGHGERGFSGWSKSKRLLDQRILEARKVTTKGSPRVKPMVDWRLHDIRRSVATKMADLGVQPHVIEAVLNHISGHKAGVAGIYNRSTYEREKRVALEMWAEHVLAIVNRRKSKVVPLRGAS